ncbi:MAG: ABC transporter permease [Muribaculaceae bacterium]|nr:ABC transporter permease [Muribaculaceae bacterium]MBQ3961256.1 ABC transporter permease [Muribaculaceae bacterium]
MKGLMWKLLRKHISTSQLIGFSIANLIGLTIVILAVQFYNDVLPIFNDEESFIRKDYVIITRNISSAGAIMGTSAEFSDEDIADIEQQPWCRKVGRFTSSKFSVVASIGGGTSPMIRTMFFFESIPNSFLDVDSTSWHFNPQRPQVPVIMSREYLSLYNFGFAATQGMPKVSEGEVSSVPLNFNLSGNGHYDMMGGRIVGFSNRLNTIIVPDEFMRWANARYGTGEVQQPLRLIIEVNRPGDPKIQSYMDAHKYMIAGDKMASSKTYYLLTLVIIIVIVIGVLISLLSFFVLMLSIYLLLQKNTKKLQDLLLLGYSPAQVSKPYVKMVFFINVAVLVASIVLMLLARSCYMPMLREMGTKGGSIVPALIVAMVIMGAITAGNVWAIRRKIKSLWIQD